MHNILRCVCNVLPSVHMLHLIQPDVIDGYLIVVREERLLDQQNELVDGRSTVHLQHEVAYGILLESVSIHVTLPAI